VTVTPTGTGESHDGWERSQEGITLSILGYREDEEWVALALEMDLRGYGPTFEEALGELRDLVAAQISFALFKGQPDMIWKPAEGVWFGLFEQVRRQYLEAAVQARTFADNAYRAAGLPIPPPHVIARLQKDFLEANA